LWYVFIDVTNICVMKLNTSCRKTCNEVLVYLFIPICLVYKLTKRNCRETKKQDRKTQLFILHFLCSGI